jgi:Leucine-rich repeat (LRR) protein
MAKVDIIMVLKGDKKTGPFEIATLDPIEAGQHYLLASMGGSTRGTDFLAVPELAVVPIPENFDFDSLEGKALTQQLHMVFSRRLFELQRKLAPLLEEQKLLEKALKNRTDNQYVSTDPVRIGNIHSTFAADHNTGKVEHFQIDSKQMQWSVQSDARQTGYIYFQDPDTHLPLWEFSPLQFTDSDDWNIGSLNVRFYGMNSPSKPEHFGYQAIDVKVGQVILARRTEETDKLYAIRFDKQEDGKLWAKYTIVEGKSLRTQDCVFYSDRRIVRQASTLTIRSTATDEDLEGIKDLQGITQINIGGSEAFNGPGSPWPANMTAREGFRHLRNFKDLLGMSASIVTVPDILLEQLSEFAKLKTLSLVEATITDKKLSHLAELTQLEELWLDFNPQITDVGLNHLQNLNNLKVLRFFQSPITDEGFATFKNMKKLEDLQVGKSRITDRSMKLIGQMKNLQTLDLQGTKITDAGAAQLAKLKHLKWLCLKDTAITDAGIKHIRNLTELKWLFLGNTKITDNGLDHLTRLTKLKTLNLPKTDITDKGLEKLTALKNLERLRLQQTKTTQQGRDKLKSALPTIETIEATMPN